MLDKDNPIYQLKQKHHSNLFVYCVTKLLQAYVNL